MLGVVDEVQLGQRAVRVLHGHLNALHQPGDDVGDSLAAVHQLILGHGVGVVLTWDCKERQILVRKCTNLAS